MSEPIPLEPLPETQPTASQSPVQPVIADATQCVICGYPLRGLPQSGRCPECGTAIERSLHGYLLRYSSPVYLSFLHRGVFLIQAAIIAQFLMMLLLIFAAIAIGAMTGAEPLWLEPLFGFLGLGIAAVSLYGWWLFSAPDPAYTGILTGATARHVLRTVVIVEAAFAVIELLLQFYAMSLRTAANPNPTAIDALQALTALVNVALLAIWFFSAMLYIRWLAPRIPNRRVDDRARLMMWLGPVLCTVGALACGLGPLIALILFYNLLDWMRQDIRRLRAVADSSLAKGA